MPIYVSSITGGALRQGEILSSVVEARLDFQTLQAQTDLELAERLHPLAIIMTQDCDLDWDFKARQETDGEQKRKLASKLIPNILLCELWRADELRGEQDIKSDIWRRVRGNQDERYHVLAQISREADSQAEGFPELVIDFKRVFTVPTDELYYRLTTETRRRLLVNGLFMQDLSTRFACYHLRVALPMGEPPVEVTIVTPTTAAPSQLQNQAPNSRLADQG